MKYFYSKEEYNEYLNGQNEKEKEFSKITIGKTEKWLVDSIKKIGLNIEEFSHETTSHFRNHVLDRHGDEVKEAKLGQIAIKKEDFDKISEIIKSPDYVIIGGKYKEGEFKGRDFIAYAKKMKDGTMLYYEVVLGKKKKTIRGKTMYKHKDDIDEQKFLNIVKSGDKIDSSNLKIINPAATGG